jgi:hypothetical protein
MCGCWQTVSGESLYWHDICVFKVKHTAMKKTFIFLFSLIIFSSCATTNESRLSRAEARKDKKAENQAAVKEAIDSKTFVIKFNRGFGTHGGVVDLVPRANYIIINGNKAEISTAYLGRQYDFRGIIGINMRGRAVNYEITNDMSKGRYKVNLKVENSKGTAFDLYLDISKNGYCTASLSSLKIENVRYSGYIVPFKIYPNETLPETSII